jgi:hypothetical protein
MGLALPLRIGSSLCASGLAHRRGRWAAGKIPAPQHNQSAIRGCWGAAAKGAAALRPYDPAPFAIRRISPHSPLATRYSPCFTIRNSLFAIRRIFHSPFAVSPHSPLATRHSLLAVFRHSLFAIRRISPLAARRSLLAIFHHSPFAIRDSLFAVFLRSLLAVFFRW